jgi:glycosyltransferase involved in cell wall biosynthesis
MVRGMIDAGGDVRIFQFRDPLAQWPEWLNGRVIEVDRYGQWGTWEETEAARSIMGERMRALIGAPQPDGWQPQCVVALGDPAAIVRTDITQFLPDGLPAWHYVPIEGVGLPPLWQLIWQRWNPIAMSEFGAKQIEELVQRPVPVVYHGVDTSVFYKADHNHPIPWPEQDPVESRVDAKRKFGIDPKVTVILRCDANAPRKAWGAFLRSMAPVLEKHRDAVVFCHTPMIGEGGNMLEHRSHLPPQLAERVMLPDFHGKVGPLPRYVLATLYNAADVYVSNSSEGFGLTIAEALACGTPAVGVAFSSVPEVIGSAGIVVPVRLVENIYAHWWGVGIEDAVAKATDFLISDKKARWTAAGIAPGHIARHFNWSVEAAKMLRILEGDSAPIEVAGDPADNVAIGAPV